MKSIDSTEGPVALPERARRRWLSDRATRRKARAVALRRVGEVRA
jgi:hypothetical protein